MTYPPLNEQIKEFGVNWLYCGKLEPIPTIKSIYDYNHTVWELHHYVREQMYYRNPEKYKGKQELILLPRQLHRDLHSSMSDARFYEKWKIERDVLIYRHRKVE